MMPNQLAIFISHRHPDHEIASAIRENLELWGVPESRIFQSTHPASGVSSGDEIQSSLIEQLRMTDLFILVYTTPDQDWSYCMWELGVANANDTKPTQVVCFSCSDESPKLMTNSFVNKITHEDVKRFTINFHRTDDFLCSHEKTLDADGDIISALSNIGESALETRAVEFYKALKEKIPTGEVKVLHRWDYLKVYLEPSAIRSIKDIEDESENGERQFALIEKLGTIHEESQNSALRAFGYQDFETGISLLSLKERWLGEVKEKRISDKRDADKTDTGWARDLYADILRAIFNKKAQRTFSYFESIAIDQPTFFRPAVIKAKTRIDDSMEFDVYLYRLAANEMQLIDTLRASDDARKTQHEI